MTDKVEVLRDDAYNHTNNHMSKIEALYKSRAYHGGDKHVHTGKTEEFKYPCVKYMPLTKPDIVFLYSNTKDKGHFGIPKVMFGACTGYGRVEIDTDGSYGMCEFVAGVVCYDKEEQILIKKALESDKFIELMGWCEIGRSGINRYVLAEFRKDFYLEFV